MEEFKIGDSINWLVRIDLEVDGHPVTDLSEYRFQCAFKGRNKKFPYTPAKVEVQDNMIAIQVSSTYHWIPDRVDMDIRMTNDSGWTRTTPTFTFKAVESVVK